MPPPSTVPTLLGLSDGTDLPGLPGVTPFLLASAIAAAWLALRVQVLRRRLGRREDRDLPLPAPRWLAALAGRSWVPTVLVLVAIALAAGAFLLARAPGG